MGLMPWLAILGVVACLFLSAFFALAETALFSLSKWQLRQLEEKADPGAQMVNRLMAAPQDLLATIVLGNTFANAGMVVLAAWTALGGRWSLGLAILFVLLLTLFGGEVIPKTLAIRRPQNWALRLAGPMLALQNLSKPFRQIAQKLVAFLLDAAVPSSVKPLPVASDEYHELVEMAFQQGTLAATEREIILQIINLDRKVVKEVMRPRSQMACISDDLSVEEMIAAARKFKHRRLPIYDGTPDTIVGVLNTRRLLLDPDIELSEAIEFPSFVPESMNLLQLLKSFQRQQRGLAIVLDEFGGTAGVTSMEDILELTVGEIHSEAGTEGFVIEKIGEGKWRANGTMRLEDFRRLYPGLGEVGEVETLGGLMVAQCEVVPPVGQSISFQGLKMTVHVADERRVKELLVEIARPKGGG